MIVRRQPAAARPSRARAEVSTSNGDWRGWIRLTQAEALACLDQRPAATAILVSLTTATDPQLAGAITYTLGGLKLRDGDAAGGFRMLAAALVRPDSPTWPARANAEADLGLAFLMRNDEANSMKWLHSAQSSFAAANDTLGLHQSLWNMPLSASLVFKSAPLVLRTANFVELPRLIDCALHGFAKVAGNCERHRNFVLRGGQKHRA